MSYNIDTYTSIIRLNEDSTECEYEYQIQSSFYKLNEKTNTHISYIPYPDQEHNNINPEINL